jgi:hypothetical protein
MTTVRANFRSGLDAPLVTPGNLPTIRIRRTDTQALVVTDAAMTEQGEGNFTYLFSPVDGLEYTIRADGDPTGTGQTLVGERYAHGSLSGTEEARIETDIPTILADTDDIQTRLPAALIGGRMDSHIADMATDVLTADALAADAVAEIANATFGLVARKRVNQAWTRSLQGGSRLRGLVSLELEGIYETLPGTATLQVQLRDSSGSLLFSQSGITPNAQGFFFVEESPFSPAPGTVIASFATIVDGLDTYVSVTELAVPDF